MLLSTRVDKYSKIVGVGGWEILIYSHHLLSLMEVVGGGDSHVGRPMPLHACLLECMLIVQVKDTARLLARFKTLAATQFRMCGSLHNTYF